MADEDAISCERFGETQYQPASATLTADVDRDTESTSRTSRTSSAAA